MIKSLLTLSMVMLTAVAFAQSGAPDKVVTFRFVPGENMFYIPWSGNDIELNLLYALVDEYRAEITSGALPVRVDGYRPSGWVI